MLRILIEKDHQNTHTKISNCLCSKIPQKFTTITQDANCILLKIGLPKSIRLNRKKKLLKLLNIAVDQTVNYTLTQATMDITKDYASKLSNLSVADRSCVANEAFIRITKTNQFNAQRHNKASWYSVIKKRIMKNMLESGIFAISAFIRFRINDYKEYIGRIVEHLGKLKINELKYLEFISSLQCFVESRRSVIDEVTINVNEDSYSLTDSNGKAIDISKYKNMLDKDTDKEDLLMSVLLTLAPKQIILNADESFMDSDFFASLVNVFAGRLKASYNAK